jgi:hypothetical protein
MIHPFRVKAASSISNSGPPIKRPAIMSAISHAEDDLKAAPKRW